jgi:pimeloyl-ACP methyl ester carboxylesterase
MTRKTKKRQGRLIESATYEEGTVKSFDGTPIVYRSVGKSDVPIICCNGLGVGAFFWVYFEEYFHKNRQIITWDYRGHGSSGLNGNPENYSIHALVKDGKAVMDRLAVKKAIFVGHSLGAQVVLEIYRQYPKRVAGLIPCFGTDGRPMNTFYNTRISRYLFKACYEIGQRFPTPSNYISRLLLQNPLSFYLGGLLKIMNTGMINKEDVDRYIEHILDVNPVFFTELLKNAQEHTAQDILPDIKVPTLIIAGEHDQFTPLWISKKMHRLIPESELFIVKKGSHAALVEQPELLNLRIDKFLQERVDPKKKKARSAA